MNKMLLATALIIPLMLITAPIGYASNPLPDLPLWGGEWGNYVGPDVTGTLTFVETYVESSPGGDMVLGVVITFNGSCKNIPLLNKTTSIPLDVFDCISPEWLLGTCKQSGCICTGNPEMVPDSLVPNECYPDKKYVYYPVVYKVTHFISNGTTKSADVVLRFPVIINK